MKALLLALALVSVAPLAYAQPMGQPPGPPGMGGPPPPDFRGQEWRRPGDGDWRRREEFREAQYRRMEWRRAHCVRDYSGHEFCR
jgi:hypothetical protein